MSVVTKNSGSDLSHGETAFALAITVLRDRVRRLSSEDRNDLYELIPHLLGGDEEEQASAQRAVKEILDQSPGSMQKLPLPLSPGKSLANWIQFISGRIREARQKAGLTQDELAAKSGLLQSHICRLEKGQHSPTAVTLEKIAQALGVDASFFDPEA